MPLPNRLSRHTPPRYAASARAARAVRLAALLGCAVLAACATRPDTSPAPTDIIPFSSNRPGVAKPRGWHNWIITRAKAPTMYELVVDPTTKRVVLHAFADRAATGLRQRLDVDPATRPVVAWQWRVVRPIEGADNTTRHADDAPARLLLFFDGDANKLSVREQVLRDTARLLTGQEVPYATLIYVWENRQPPGTVIPHHVTSQVRMVVAGSDAARIGQWKSFARNYVADYQRAFGVAPGRLIGVGILTDTDNTQSVIEAYYGDIELRPDEP
jgi:hypothetical protein